MAFLNLALLPGLVMIAFPGHIHRFYTWFHGEAYTRRGNQPRHIRNAGIFWLVIVAAMSYFDPVRR
jgi:hypothetical protein